MKIVCVFPTHRRKAITLETIRMLRKQTVVPHVILVGDSHIEAEIAERAKVEYVQHPNFPLSIKWQAGIERAAQRKPDAVLIIGSDTFLSPKWCEQHVKHFDTFDVVGSPSWHVMHLTKDTMRIIKCSYEGVRADQPCGQGRLFSSKAMRAMEWVLFPGRKHGRIDTMSLRRARLSGCKIASMELGEVALTIKSSAWIMKHSFAQFMAAKGLVRHPDVSNPGSFLKLHLPGAWSSIVRLRKRM